MIPNNALMSKEEEVIIAVIEIMKTVSVPEI
jgi:hypothetical protein